MSHRQALAGLLAAALATGVWLRRPWPEAAATGRRRRQPGSSR